MSSASISLVAALIAVVAAVQLVDPTMPPQHVVASEQAPSLRLQAIFRTQDRAFAVIDGQRVTEGDRIGAWRVVEIRPDAVRLRDDQLELELRLAPAIRRTAPTRGGEP